MSRASGVLMHVSSLWGDYSIGSFGAQACEFVDFLSESGFSFWQVLPFCMADESNSPYKSLSAFGANPYFIDLPTLWAKGLISRAELDSARQRAPYLCEYSRLAKERIPLLRRAASRASEELREQISRFICEHEPLGKAAEFLALRETNSDKPWYEWTVSEPDSDAHFFW